MVRGPNNPRGINQHTGDRQPVPLRLPKSLVEEIDNWIGTAGGTRTGFIETACRDALDDQFTQSIRAVEPKSGLPEVVKDAIATTLDLKQSALRAEQKKKKPNQDLIGQWQREIDELEAFL